MFGLSQKEKDKALSTALYYENKSDALKALEKGADPNNSPVSGTPGPLHWAAQHHDQDNAQEIIDALLDKGADINFLSQYGENVLFPAMEQNNYHTFLHLMEKGANPQQPAADGKTIFERLVSRQNWSAVRFMLERNVPARHPPAGVLIDLIEASAPEDILMKQLAKVDDVNAVFPDRRFNALTAAAQKGNDAAVNLLLARPDIDVNIAPRGGRTPLIFALNQGRTEMAVKLIERGADIFATEDRGLDALRWAALKGSIPVLRIILARAKEQGRELELDRAMISAAFNGQSHVVGLLIEAGAKPDAVDEKGRTAASKAAEEGHLSTLKMLNRHKADVTKTDDRGVSPLDYAAQARKDEAKAYLDTLQPGYVPPPPVPPPVDTTRFVRVSDTTIDVKERNGITMTFNFWTQQLLYRETERGSAISVQSFTDVPRREAVMEAFDKLKQLGGRPPEPFADEGSKKIGLPKP